MHPLARSDPCPARLHRLSPALPPKIVCIASDAARHVRRGAVTAREVGLTLVLVAALLLTLLTAADMFFTAKIYHVPEVGGWLPL
jgi:hypothetical protein